MSSGDTAVVLFTTGDVYAPMPIISFNPTNAHVLLVVAVIMHVVVVVVVAIVVANNAIIIM